MRSILEKAIVHLLNGEQEKAEALFHKFMVEKGRGIHESLRQNMDVELGEGWDDEIHEEEYFDDGDLTSAEDDQAEDTGGDVDTMAGAEGGADDVVDDMGGEGDEDGDVPMADDSDVDDDTAGLDDEHTEIVDKLDDLEDKISELTAEFDRLMGEFEGGAEGEDFGGDEDLEGGDEFTGDGSEEGEEPNMDAGEADDLASRMDTDMGTDDGETEPEEKTMEGEDMDGMADDELDEDLADITESVLSELDKVAAPGNSDGKEVGTGKTIAGNRNSGVLPKHGVNDRVAQASPDHLMSTQDQNDKFEPAWRDEKIAPVKPVTNLVQGARNSRKSWQDDTKRMPKDGDGSAALNSNFAGNEPKGRSPVDGSKKPRVR